MTVLDIATARTMAGPVDRAQFGGVDWAEDGRSLTFARLQNLAPGAPAAEKYRNLSAEIWNLKGKPQPLLGPKIGGDPITDPDEGGQITRVPHTDTLLLAGFTGVKTEARLWWGKQSDLAAGNPRWTPLLGYDDGITKFDANATTLFLLSHQDAPHCTPLA